MVEDYLVSKFISVLYLSLKYHMTYPRYIEERLEKLYYKKPHSKRILLVVMDTSEAELHATDTAGGGFASLNDVYIQCGKFATTCLMAWSNEEAARYLYTLKSYEKKTDKVLQGWNGCGHQGSNWGKEEWARYVNMDDK